jgi:hypothetical protein
MTIFWNNSTSTNTTTNGWASGPTIYITTPSRPVQPPPHPADRVPLRLVSRILSVAALHDRAGTDGERDAAACALLRLWDRAQVKAKDRAVVLAELRRRGPR